MSEGPASTPESDVYTILLIVATLIIAAGTVYLGVRMNQLFGTWNPFTGT